MTQKEKIENLVNHIKNEFPNGCEEINCRDCPINGYKRGTVEHSVCVALGWMDHKTRGDNNG